MRALLSGIVLAVLFVVPMSAGPCVVDTLTTYVGLGGAGCSLGPFTVTDFNFTVLSFAGGATPVSDSNIIVTPLTLPLGYGFEFASEGFSVTGEGSVQYLLEYFWDPGPIRSLEDVLFAASPVAPGTAMITTVGCLDAPFTFGNCGAQSVSSTVFHFGAGDTHLIDTVSFGTVYTMGIRHVIDLQANGASADIQGFRSSVLTPEPAYLLPAGIAFLILLRRLRG